MCRIIPPLCALVVGGLGTACGVSQSRYDALLTRVHRLESRTKSAEDALAHAQRRLGQRWARRTRKRAVRRPVQGSSLVALKRSLRRCRKELQATRRPLVLSSHTREQDIGGGRRRTSTVTLMPGTVILPLTSRRSQRNQRARRAERTLRRAIAKRLATLAACYHRRAAGRRRPPQGALSFAFMVTRAGRTQRVTVVHRLLRDRATERCALRMVRRLRLPRHGQALWAVFPVEFHASRHYPSAPPIAPRARR